MVRSLILGVALLTQLGGCAAPDCGHVSQPNASKVGQAENRSWSNQWAAAYGKMDRFADGVGRVLFPPLFVAASPLWVLCGFGASSK